MKHLVPALLILAGCQAERAPESLELSRPVELDHAPLSYGADALQRGLPNLALHHPVERVGFLWDAPTADSLEVRINGAWLKPVVTHSEDGHHAGHVDARGTGSIEVRTTGATWLLVDPIEKVGEPGGPASIALPESNTGNTKDALAAFPAINDRGSWGARAPTCISGTNPYRVAVHHTVTPTPDSASPESRLRQTQNYHMDSRGYCDIAYNFLVSADGRVWTGRGATTLGGHTGNQNGGNVGICYIGTFTDVAPTPASICSGAGLLAWLNVNHGIALNGAAVMGHRDYPGQATECPGNSFHPLLGQLIDTAINGCGPKNIAPRGALDVAGCDGLAGWAQDQDAPTAAIDAHLYFDGPAGVGTGVAVTANKKRDDLCAPLGSCEHAFQLPAPRALLDGQSHAVYLYGIDTAGGLNPELGQKTLQCAAPLPAGKRRHVVDMASFNGWKFSLFWDVQVIADAARDAIPETAPFPAQPQLVRLAGATELYLFERGYLRPIANPLAWRIDPAAAHEVAQADFESWPKGPDLPEKPQLIRGAGGLAVYVLDVDLPSQVVAQPVTPEPGPSALAPAPPVTGGVEAPEVVGTCGCGAVPAGAPLLMLLLVGLRRRSLRTSAQLGAPAPCRQGGLAPSSAHERSLQRNDSTAAKLRRRSRSHFESRNLSHAIKTMQPKKKMPNPIPP